MCWQCHNYKEIWPLEWLHCGVGSYLFVVILCVTRGKVVYLPKQHLVYNVENAEQNNLAQHLPLEYSTS